MIRRGLCTKTGRKFKAITHPKHELPVAKNMLQQNFSASAPNQHWVSDITYLWTQEGWLYLATVIDLYSRKVVGWAMSERMTADLVGNALMMVLWNRGMPKGVMVHSDRGSQYCSALYQRLLTKHGLLCSMSGKGNCCNNACAESFFYPLKVEAIHGGKFETREKKRRVVFAYIEVDYIEVDYNRMRRHSTNGQMSPVALEAKRVAQRGVP